MSSRLRQRSSANTATEAGGSSSRLPLRSSNDRATRHASLRTYAEVSESEEEEEYYEEDEHEHEREQDSDDSDESLADSDSDDGEGEPGDRNFTARLPSKRQRLDDVSTPDNSPSKRRRQPQRRATAEFLVGDDAYLSPSSDGAPRRRQKPRTVASSSSAPAHSAAPTASTPSPRRSRRDAHDANRKNRGGKSTPTKSGKQVVIHIDDKKSAGGKGDGVRTPTMRALSPPRTNRPPWSTLPYLVLSSIFSYGAAPLDNITSVRWLLAASRTCRGFTEPALRALYESPPMLTMNMAHNLVDHLAKDPSTTLFDYRQKVKALKIDVGSLASRVYKGRHLDIPRLVSYCPRLVDLDLYHYKDMPPYREQTENLRWTYPDGLFEALGAVQPAMTNTTVDSSGHGDPQEEGSSASMAPLAQAAVPTAIRLKSWRWNQRLMGRDLDLDRVRTLHLSPTFAGLCKISLVNYQRPSLNARNAEDPEVIEADRQQAVDFAGLLNALPNLTHLAVESSTAANDLILPLLPKTLQHLELVNCWDVTADQFAEYLVTHGQELRQLTLHYNQSLSLSFLSVLGTACPQLQALRMNLTYYSHHAFYNDSNPMYDTLLTADEVPAWPASIEVIELEHLRKWEPAAAEVFFQSLVDSAPHVPQLRVLAIKAMLDIPWRQRCEMRDRWEATLDRVFKRRTTAPEPASSLAYYTKPQKHVSPRSKAKARHSDAEPSRRSHRIATHVSNPSSRASSTTRGLRHMAPTGRMSYREPDTDEDIPSSDEDDEDKDESVGKHTWDEKGKGVEQASRENSDHETDKMDISGGEGSSSGLKRTRPFVHGMCDVVDIRIDNQKPGEIQYRMVDFLDSDDSNSDDEWTGDGPEANDYAW
ncbi:uncharacterized protein SPSK_01462 [Sporothrix schenckii 1099-18]|uniref:Uncharacterized protein n=1 Tax=Sporothrix schenckii 1099-18 TaxID=1397361 RepID=A0A0F2MCD0_SPOSC|nr:uncharacterized protein SPSK_01462 [Sporothrix schenckii 1099-18]KJR87363.1 hypothetical protein SPSK_01462 [Sporothrix schenckii 1099-18]